MSFRWTEATERMMLIKFLEQNLPSKFDAKAAIAQWPTGSQPPTERSIGDRLSALKKRLREGHQDLTVSGRVVRNTPKPAVPKTPHRFKSLAAARRTKSGQKRNSGEDDKPIIVKKREVIDVLESDDDADAVKDKCNERAHQTKKIKVSAAESMSGGKQSSKAMENNDKPLSDNDDDNSDDGYVDFSTAFNIGRRSLPRRSKTVTPVRTESNEDGSTNINNGDIDDDGDESSTTTRHDLAVDDMED